MVQPNNDEDDYVFPETTEVNNDERDNSLTVINNPASPMSTGWAILWNSDSSSDATSEPIDVKASPDRSFPGVHHRTLDPQLESWLRPALSATIPRPRPAPTFQEALRQSEPTSSASQSFDSAARKPIDWEGRPARTLSGGNTNSSEAGPSRRASHRIGLNSTGDLREQVLHSNRISKQDKALANEQYYRQLLRSRSVRSNYRVRDLREHAGKVPDPEWRWCGFPGCGNGACRYNFLLSWGTGYVITPLDSGRDCDILKNLLDAFGSQNWNYMAEPHSRVSFATSPPVRNAVGQFLIRFNHLRGTATGWDKGDYQAAMMYFTDMRTRDFPVLHPHNIEKLHSEMDKEISRSDSAVAPWRLILQFIMHLEAWRQHQIKQGYPWDWPFYDALDMYRTILETYQQSIDKGFSTLKTAVQAEQDKAWVLWWDRHRPWTSCKVAFLSALEDTNNIDRDRSLEVGSEGNNSSDVVVYEGVGQYKPHWWPNWPRAPGLDASLEL
ncbi:hypothetical protein HER10_EVM0012697 [Colletotrichum scovillei]|uniref:uncharacterized protein n=1 Tax=Colletotrichum scovillei TaxID=1209932 RepID=UPI0015C35350|nr:uncharacterized protein HER10_EVM0012697 [Colletotrichum scovillei]KAF4782474.1 hypothetical protein HER10_EVM0012697 [Colletotrichum scovillei]